MAAKGKIVFRADGNNATGLGHIVRTGAIADTLRHDWECTLITRCTIESILEEMRLIFSKVIMIPAITSYETEASQLQGKFALADIVVLDGYDFTANYQQAVISSGSSLVNIDDIHHTYFYSDIVINSAGGITALDYHAAPATQFFLGPKYTLIRKPFLEKAKERRNTVSNNDVFICLGGADPENNTLSVVQFVENLQRFSSMKIVVGGAYLYAKELEEYIKFAGVKAEIYKQVSADKMADIMSTCSYAVCSPSTVSYEYMTLGGVVYLKQIASNQQDMIGYLIQEGYAFSFEQAGITTTDEELRSLEKQAAIFDGKAGERLRGIFDKLHLSKKINVRRAILDDMMICYDWANDPDVRRQSFNQNEITISDHENWFNKRLHDTNCFFYILELEGKPFAQIRFQVSESEAVLSYLVAREYRGKGFGTTILSKGIDFFTKEYGKKTDITGFVKFSNIASQQSFERMQFHKSEAVEYDSSYKYNLHYDGN